MLIVMVGLPGAGKSRFAKDLAQRLAATMLSADDVEAVLESWPALTDRAPRDLVVLGAAVLERLAESNLRTGSRVIIDACNVDAERREGWRALADRVATPLVFVEMVCSDESVREARAAEEALVLPSLPHPRCPYLPECRRQLERWDEPRFVVDSMDDHEQNLTNVLLYLGTRDVVAV